MLAVHSPIRRGLRTPPAGLASGAASPELGLWAGTQTRRISPETPAHISAGEESAREPTSVIQFLAPTESASGSPGLKTPARGLGSLVLSVRSFVWAAKEPLKEPCCCPSLPSDRAFTAGALGSVQPTSP